MTLASVESSETDQGIMNYPSYNRLKTGYNYQKDSVTFDQRVRVLWNLMSQIKQLV